MAVKFSGQHIAKSNFSGFAGYFSYPWIRRKLKKKEVKEESRLHTCIRHSPNLAY